MTKRDYLKESWNSPDQNRPFWTANFYSKLSLGARYLLGQGQGQGQGTRYTFWNPQNPQINPQNPKILVQFLSITSGENITFPR